MHHTKVSQETCYNVNTVLFTTSRYCPSIPEALNFCSVGNVICLEDAPLQLFLSMFNLKYITFKVGYNSILLEASATKVRSSKRLRRRFDFRGIWDNLLLTLPQKQNQGESSGRF